MTFNTSLRFIGGEEVEVFFIPVMLFNGIPKVRKNTFNKNNSVSLVLFLINFNSMRNSLMQNGLIVLLFVVHGCANQQMARQKDPENPMKTTATSNPLLDCHNSMQALDWPGVYKGTIPCADCSGLTITLTLLKDHTFNRGVTYLGKEARPRYDKGTFTWNSSGSVIILRAEDGTEQFYQVGENVLFHLDREEKRITGELADQYILHKNLTDARLEGKKWILTELMGQTIGAGQTAKQAFLLFHPETATFTGNGSCNNLFGPYELKPGDRIVFGEAAGTLMACPDMDLEKRFFEVLKSADNYSLSDTSLSLNKARMAPLARFVAERP
jgi:heat shock protein HslJ